MWHGFFFNFFILIQQYCSFIFFLRWHLLRDRGLLKWKNNFTLDFLIGFYVENCVIVGYGKFNIPIRVFCFKNIYNKCHMPSLTKQDVRFYCYTCKATIPMQTQAWIACKIKHESGREFDYVLFDFYIKTFLDHDLGTL